MKKEIESILPKAINFYLLASSPLFLFKSLRGLADIQILASKYSTEQLMGFYSKSVIHKSIDKLCLYYIILISLSFRPYEEANKPLQSLSKEKYVWAKELVEIVLSSFESFQVVSIFLEKKPVIQQHFKSLRNLVTDSTTSINFKGKDNEN